MAKKFDRVLSDDWLPLEFQSGNSVPVTSVLVNLRTLKSIVEQTEQAVLAKLVEQQEPAAWLHEETGDIISSELKEDATEMLKGYNTPLYKCPCFSCKGKLEE